MKSIVVFVLKIGLIFFSRQDVSDILHSLDKIEFTQCRALSGKKTGWEGNRMYMPRHTHFILCGGILFNPHLI